MLEIGFICHCKQGKNLLENLVLSSFEFGQRNTIVFLKSYKSSLIQLLLSPLEYTLFTWCMVRFICINCFAEISLVHGRLAKNEKFCTVQTKRDVSTTIKNRLLFN